MKRLSIIVGLVGIMLSGAALADEAAFCKSECDSARSQCKANTGKASGDDAVAMLSTQETNAFARTAQDPVAGAGTKALERSGQQNRRAQQLGICDDKYKRRTRTCAAPGGTDGAFPVRRHGNTG